MSDNKNNNYAIGPTAGNWLGIIGIILGIIGFFWQPVAMGIAAIILGIIGLFSPKKPINVVAIIIGIIALIVYYV